MNEIQESKPFDFIRRVEPTHLVPFIQQELPQTIALVLSYLEPKKASVIIQNLPKEIQADVVRRIATMDRVIPEILREVERVLEIGLVNADKHAASGGLDNTVEIMNLMDRTSEKKIIECLEDEDPELTEEIKKRMSILKKIVMLNDKFIRHLDISRHRKDYKESSQELAIPDKKLLQNKLPDQIDRFLTAINADHTGLEESSPAAGAYRIRMYDFTRPDKFSRKQIHAISMIHDTFARLTTNSLSAQIRSMVHVHVASVDQLTYEEYIRSVPTPTTLAIINMDPLKGNALLEISPDITFSILDRCFGGTGEKTKSQHELTNIEISVMEGIIVRILGNIREAWGAPVTDLHPRLGQLDTNPQFAQIVPPTEMVVLITMEVKIGDVKGSINFCIPYLTLEPVMPILSGQYWYSSIKRKEKSSPEHSFMENIEVELTASLMRRNYRLGDVQEWENGTVIYPLRKTDFTECQLVIGDTVFFKCHIEDETNPAYFKRVKISQVIEPYKERIMEMQTRNAVKESLKDVNVRVSVELGHTNKLIKEVLDMGEGTFVELDTIAGEPLDVCVNGKCIAKGETVVMDEYFGVRIVEICGEV